MKKLIFFVSVFICSCASDTLFAQWICSKDYMFWQDSVDFETPSSYIKIDTTSGNIWQIGKPQKTFFNNSYSPLNVIVTDTVNFYPTNNMSSFILVIPDSAIKWGDRTNLRFWHKYDMDTLLDKGIIEESFDGGNIWFTLKDTFGFTGASSGWCLDYHLSTGNYTTHDSIVTGKSDGWVLSTYEWIWYLIASPPLNPDTMIINPDSLLIRFTFKSDSINNNREGWMIDQIVFELHQDPGGIEDFSYENSILLFPNPAEDEITFICKDSRFKPESICVYDALGRAIAQYHQKKSEWKINVSHFPPGIYFAILRDHRGKIISKRFAKI